MEVKIKQEENDVTNEQDVKMDIIAFNEINWRGVSEKLKYLRKHNLNLRRYSCFYSRNNSKCDATNCLNCSYEMDEISQSELADVLGVNVSQLQNWESNRTIPPLEFLLYYSKICKIPLEDLLVFKK